MKISENDRDTKQYKPCKEQLDLTTSKEAILQLTEMAETARKHHVNIDYTRLLLRVRDYLV